MNLEMELAESTREQLYRSILDSSHLDLEYVSMLAFAGLIALFGLLQNSVAVIIGAMLISPLMNPILAAALALILGYWSLGRRAASVLASGYALAVEAPDARTRLARQDQLALAGLIAILRKRPDLQLLASMGSEGLDAEAIKASRLWREVSDILRWSRLKAAQWSMQITPVAATTPPEAPPSKAAPAVPTAKRPVPPELPRAVRCDFRVYQLF